MGKVYILKNKNSICIFLISIAIFMLSYLGTQNARVPFVFNDEYGYWSNAAWMTGYNWSDTTSEINWYSYGYSLILAIVIFITKDFLLAYRIAILINCILLSLSYIILYAISLRFTKKNNLVYSLIPVLYSSIWIQKNYAWPEILLYFLYILIIYVIINIYESGKTIWFIGLGVCLTFMYMVHMRTIGIILASIIFLFFIPAKKRKSIICFLIVLVSGIILQVVLKNYFSSNLWRGSDLANSNGYASVISSSMNEVTIQFILNMFGSFLGKLYYLFLSSFGLVYVFILKTFSSVKTILKERELKTDIVYYCFFCLFFSVGIAAIFMRDPQYTTHLLYGRYTENILAPILLIAVIHLLENNNICWRKYCIYVLICLIMGIVLNNLIEFMELPHTNIPINSIGFSSFYKEDEINLHYVTLTFMLLSTIFLFSKYLWGKRERAKYVVIFMVALFWFKMGFDAYKAQELHSSEIVSKDEVIELCTQIDEAVDYDLFMYRGSNYWKTHACAEIVQFYFPDKRIKYIDKREDISSLNHSIVFFISSDYKRDFEDKYLSEGKTIFYEIIE